MYQLALAVLASTLLRSALWLFGDSTQPSERASHPPVSVYNTAKQEDRRNQLIN